MKIFPHPTSHNIGWRDVTSLLEVVGTIDERHDGTLFVNLAGEVAYVDAATHIDIDVQMVVDVRCMLGAGG